MQAILVKLETVKVELVIQVSCAIMKFLLDQFPLLFVMGLRALQFTLCFIDRAFGELGDQVEAAVKDGGSVMVRLTFFYPELVGVNYRHDEASEFADCACTWPWNLVIIAHGYESLT